MIRCLYVFLTLVLVLECSAAPAKRKGKPAKKPVAKSAVKPVPKQPKKLTAAEAKAAAAAFDVAIAFIEEKKFKEALIELQKALKIHPTNPNVLWNAGLSAQLSGNPKLAAAYFERNLKEELENGHVVGKLIQSYEAFGDTRNRDLRPKQLFAMHRSGKDVTDYSQNERYLRDQFTVNGDSVFAFEFFELKPRSSKKDSLLFGRRYEFFVFSPDNEEDVKMRLEAGWNSLEHDGKGGYKPGTELAAFYLDAYYPDQEPRRKTFGLFEEELSYEMVKKYFIAIAEGKLEPTSWGPCAGVQRSW